MRQKDVALVRRGERRRLDDGVRRALGRRLQVRHPHNRVGNHDRAASRLVAAARRGHAARVGRLQRVQLGGAAARSAVEEEESERQEGDDARRREDGGEDQSARVPVLFLGLVLAIDAAVPARADAHASHIALAVARALDLLDIFARLEDPGVQPPLARPLLPSWLREEHRAQRRLASPTSRAEDRSASFRLSGRWPRRRRRSRPPCRAGTGGPSCPRPPARLCCTSGSKRTQTASPN
mmetsp:Transcript_15343/g.50172  ORF Transcript_15343/g.50172 Transcript_15343/m.50172 type:complete len:238 (-) Transcript_15343:1326-2039(-)